MNRLSLQLSTLEKIFPFSFIVDGEFKIRTAGRSIKKLFGDYVDGNHFESHLQFLKPSDTFPENFNSLLDQLVLLEEKNTNARLFGQFIKPNSSEIFVFIGSLSASTVHEVTRLKLNFNDFPLQDQIFDFLMLTQAQNRTIEEAHELNLKLKQANSIARNASDMKSQFLANMSHELRTPMNGIIGMAELMQETTELNSDQSEYVSGILSSAESLLALINDILDLSKIESGHIELNEEEVSLSVLIEEIFSSLKVLAEKRNNKLGFNIHDRSEKIVTDPRKLKQILINLIGNANKFTHGGLIQIDIFGIQEQSVKFMVTDTGIGMNSDIVEKLFSPFVQGDSAMNRKYGGTGLGLSICKKLIESLGGAIAVESRPNFGSKFTFTIMNKHGQTQIESPSTKI